MSESKEEQLVKLKELYDKNLISKDRWEAQQDKILNPTGSGEILRCRGSFPLPVFPC